MKRHFFDFEKGLSDLLGYIYLDGENTVPNEFDAPYLNEGYDFIRDIERLIGYSTV